MLLSLILIGLAFHKAKNHMKKMEHFWKEVAPKIKEEKDVE